MSIIAWIVLGAIAGYLAGFLVKGDEGLGVIGHIVLGIVGALVGGFLASVLFNTEPDRRRARHQLDRRRDHRRHHRRRRGVAGHADAPARAAARSDPATAHRWAPVGPPPDGRPSSPEAAMSTFSKTIHVEAPLEGRL